MKKTLQITGIILAILTLFFCVLSMGLYFIIQNCLPSKIVDTVVNAGELQNVDAPDEKYILNVNYYSNDSGNGIELFEIKINNYMNSDTALSDNPDVYSKGLQLIGPIEFKSNVVSLGNQGFWQSQNETIYSTTAKKYYYDTQNFISSTSAVPLSDKSNFRISIEDDIYLMTFAGSRLIKSEVRDWGWTYRYSVLQDLNYFSMQLFNIVDSLDYGSGKITHDLGTTFKFKKLENGSYSGEWLTEKNLSDKVEFEFSNYFTINIHKYKDGATKASDSLFDIIAGDSNFKLVDKSKADDYFFGAQVIKLTEYDFLYSPSDEGYIATLKDETKKLLDKYQKNKVIVDIDYDNLKNHGIENITFEIDKKYQNRVEVTA